MQENEAEHNLIEVIPAELSSCNSAETFLQSAFWGSFKARFGWNARAFKVNVKGEGRPLLLIRRRICPGLSFAYVPWGPEFPADLPASEKNSLLSDLSRTLIPLLPRDTAFIRFDPPWYTTGEESPLPLDRPFYRAGADVQPPDSVIIDLEPQEESILQSMKPKWRYNINLSIRNNVEIKRTDEEGIKTFYSLYRETANRDGIAIHNRQYYETLFLHCQNYTGQELRLYLAEHEGEAIAAIIVLFREKAATYLYGASANHKRNLMASYALQWQAMKDARAFGCRYYDLFGIPPNEDPNHPMAGLYRFKTGFGGTIIHRTGSWDYPCRPLLCRVFNAAEYLRARIRSFRKKLKRR